MGLPGTHLLPAEGKTPVSSASWCFMVVFLSLFLALTPAAYANWRPLTERLVADNNSTVYVNTILAVADKIRGGKRSNKY